MPDQGVEDDRAVARPTSVLLRLSLSEKPSQFSVELPIRVKVTIHESSHHVSRQRGYLLTITARMNLDPLPGTVTPSRRSALHRARPVELPQHGIISGNNDDAARGIAAAVLRRHCQEFSCGGVTWITSHRARLNTFQNGTGRQVEVFDRDRPVGRGLTEILSPTGAPVASFVATVR